MVSSFWPIGILFLLIWGGYRWARRIFYAHPAKTMSGNPPEPDQSPMDTDSGLVPIGDLRIYPPEDQRKIRLREQVRTLSAGSPESAAGVIKGWLREG